LRTDRRRHAGHIAAAVVAGLFIVVLVSNVLWPGAPPTTGEQPRWPSTSSPFPILPAGPDLHVIPVGPSTNLSTRLLLVSLQGLASRTGAHLYLDLHDEVSNASSLISFLVSKYGLSVDNMTIDAAISAYLPSAAGIAVYDPARPESMNVATMKAAQQGAVLVGPDLAESLRARFNRPITFDYATSDWAALGPIASTDRAIRELYPGSAPSLLAILPPDRWAIRDYLIATRTFVFYEPQGVLATPAETAATMRVLRATPRGIPILGWFDSPTLTEENAFVQMASAEGKFVVGVQDLPNLSVLTAFGRTDTHRQVPVSGPMPDLEDNKTHVVLAVPDGDNVDFVSGRMRELWSEPERGNRTMPLAWSINPLLVDLAPPLLDWYYDTATPFDRFIAAPSGAGYLYPDYTGPGDLPAYLALTDRYMAAADLDVVWLLNAFKASEIPYSDASLSAYVSGVHPVGIVLDYDDQPRTRDAWVAAGGGNASPVIRSTHFWTTEDNFFGKLDAALAASRGGPRFLWLTVYTFRHDLRDAHGLVDRLAARVGGNFEIVTPTTFFTLLRAEFVREAGERLDAASADPIASTLFASSLSSAAAQVADARAALSSGDTDRAARSAYVALETLRGIGAAEALLSSVLVLLAAGVLAALAQRAPRRWSRAPEPIDFGALLLVTAAVAFFVFALREAVEQNFWTYPSILLGIAVAGVHRPVRRYLDRAYPARAPIVAALACLVLSSLAIRTTAAFPLAMIGALLAIDSYLARKPATPSTLVAALGFGSAIGLLGAFDLVTLSVIAVLLVLPPMFLPETAVPLETRAAPHRALYPGILMAMPLGAFAITSSYALSLRLQVQGDLLSMTAAAMFVLGATLAVVVDRAMPRLSPTIVRFGGLGLAVASAGLVLASVGSVPTTLALLGLFASLSLAALAGLREFASRGGEPHRALATAIAFLPLIVLFFRLPPIVYSLTIAPLPQAVEYVLYTPPAIIAAAALVLVAVGWVRSRGPRVAKDYPGEAHGGPGGP